MDMLDGVRRKKTERRVGSTSTLYEYCSILLLLDDHGACRQTERWPKSLDVWRFYDVGIEFVLCCFAFVVAFIVLLCCYSLSYVYYSCLFFFLFFRTFSVLLLVFYSLPPPSPSYSLISRQGWAW